MTTSMTMQAEPTPAQAFASSVHLERESATPLYLQLQAKLREMIANGTLPVGTAVPSERVLSEELQLSRMTVRRAIEALVDEKVLERRHGSGTYVCPEPVRQSIDRVLGFADEMRSLGKTAGSELVEFSTVEAPGTVAERFHIEPGTHVTRIVRIRTADGRPLALQTTFLPPRFQPFSLEKLLQYGSLYATFKAAYGIEPYKAQQIVSARLPNEDEIRHLNVDRLTPVLMITRTTVDEQRNVLEHVVSAYRSDAYQLAVALNAR